MKCIIKRKKRRQKNSNQKREYAEKRYFQLQCVEDSRKCINPNNGALPKCKIRLGKKKWLPMTKK